MPIPNTPSPQGAHRRKGTGHKPTCECRFCKNSRKRAAQAQSESDRAGRINLLPEAKNAASRDSVDPNVIQGDGIVIANGRTQRDRIAEWALMRSQGMKNPEIAAKLGIQTNSLQAMISRATQAGWLKFDNPSDRLTYELAPKIVDQIEKHIDAGSERMTIEAAKGIGLFKSYQAVKLEGAAPSMVLAIKFETPEGYTPDIADGSAIFGSPKYGDTIEGEVVEDKD